MEATGLPWSLTNGGKHFKLKLAGRLVAILSKGPKEPHHRAIKNGIMNVRRAARDNANN